MQNLLRELVESLYPLIYLVTYEEREADALIQSVADDRQILEWDMARGFVDFSTKRPSSPYQSLPDALETLLEMELDKHFIVIKDAHLAFNQNPLAVARIKALATKSFTTTTRRRRSLWSRRSRACRPSSKIRHAARSPAA